MSNLTKLSRTALALVAVGSLLLSGCNSETQTAPTNQSTPAPAAGANPASAAPVPGLLETTSQTWTPEALEDLLAPVALYPDNVLGEVLVAATNPQEVLDAGTWRLKNDSLEGKALDDAAKQAGYTPPVRMVLQNPTVLDMMCSEFGWTQELGQAYVNDQAGVLDAIQRLRRQAKDAGNLESSDQMLVETETEPEAGARAIVLSSPDPEVVYVPQYDPERVYAPADEDDHDDGVGTGTVVATALLAFGAGLAVSKIFDDDDDDWYRDDYYYPSYYGPPMPYYAHYPYRPVYAGYYPATGYVRPPTYRYAYNNTTIVRRDVDNYWTRYDNTAYVSRDRRATVSPITKVRGNRPELQYLNERSNKGPQRRAPAVAEERGKYQVKRQETAVRAGERRRREEQERRAAGVDRGERDRGTDRDRAGKADRNTRGGRDGGDGDRARDRGGKGGGNRGGDRPKAGGGNRGGDRPNAGGGNRGGDRPKAGGGNRGGDRPKAGGGSRGGDRPKAGGGGRSGGDRPKASGGNRGGNGGNRGGGRRPG